jgi:hypothetical protein
MVSAPVAHLPAAVSLLMLEALFMQISGVSLTLTWPCWLCLLRVLLHSSLCYKLSPCQAHWGRWYCTLRGKWVFPLLLWSFPPSTTLTRFPTPGCLAHTPTPTGAFPAWPSLFIYSSEKDSPPPLFRAQCTTPSFPHFFIVFIAYYSIIILGGGWSVQGAMLIWSSVVCGSTVVLLSSPCPRLPKPSGHGRLAARGPSLFLCLMWSGDSLRQLKITISSLWNA